MLDIITAHIADVKIIHHKIKCERTRGVRPKAWSEWCLMVPMEDHTLREEVVSEYAGME
jgi:hypothetical protein